MRGGAYAGGAPWRGSGPGGVPQGLPRQLGFFQLTQKTGPVDVRGQADVSALHLLEAQEDVHENLSDREGDEAKLLIEAFLKLVLADEQGDCLLNQEVSEFLKPRVRDVGQAGHG